MESWGGGLSWLRVSVPWSPLPPLHDPGKTSVQATGPSKSLVSPFVRLVLFSHAEGKQALLTCQRSTAEHFGWLKHYETYADLVIREAQASGGRVYPSRLAAASRLFGGKRLLISRSPSKQGSTPRNTHAIRINSRVSNQDLAELAALTEGEWHWMEARNFARIDKEHWLRVYAGSAKLPRTTRARAA